MTYENDSLFGSCQYVYGENGKLSQKIKDGVTKAYTYNALDQLASYDGATYTYDGMGNRAKRVKNGVTTNYGYTRGNLLASIGTGVSYSYNCEGVRYKKTVNGVTTIYYLDGNKILGEDRSDGKKLRYFYDIDGICGVRYNEENYEFVRNAYGDVVMIMLDKIPIVRYYYDVWGNCQVQTYGNRDIGNINPFRWKGHYFDVESGLYYANGSYYDPEVGLHVDAVKISSVIENAFEIFGLDINGIMCDNILAYLPNAYSIFTVLELSENPLYDPDANKPWWELAWNAVVRWFASIIQAYNDLDIGWKIGIGLVLFALACIITAVTTVLTGGGAAAVGAAILHMTITFLVGVATGVAISGAMALINGESLPDALLSGLADGIFWGGVFAFVSASVNAVKAGIRSVKNAKLARNAAVGEGGAQPTCGGKGQCFIAGTLVETEEGRKPIEEIEVGDKVLAYDEETGEQAYKEVVRLFRNQTKEWYHVFVNGEEIVCTGGHPFYVIGKGFVPAKELKETDLLELADCTAVFIEKITIETLETPETTYNFEVADFHTYYVSDSKVLVHNKCAFAEFYDNPQSLIGKSADEVGEALGEGWTRTAYGSRGDGWRFMDKHGAKIIYHPAGGKHKSAYYILQKSQSVMKKKLIGIGYNALNEKNVQYVVVNFIIP